MVESDRATTAVATRERARAELASTGCGGRIRTTDGHFRP